MVIYRQKIINRGLLFSPIIGAQKYLKITKINVTELSVISYIGRGGVITTKNKSFVEADAPERVVSRTRTGTGISRGDDNDGTWKADTSK